MCAASKSPLVPLALIGNGAPSTQNKKNDFIRSCLHFSFFFLLDKIVLSHDFAVLKLLTKAVSVTKRQTKLNFFAQGVSSFNSAEVKFLESTFCIVILCLKLAPHYNPKNDMMRKLYFGEFIFLLRMRFVTSKDCCISRQSLAL